MENNFSSLIDSAASILVMLPAKPYFDQVAAGLALYLSIHDAKEVAISCPSPMTVGFNRLIGVNKIASELGNKNLTIKFKNYDAANIEKVSYDIINGEFNLTVVPKTGFTAPQKEQIDLTYAGVAADLIILVGGANDSHFPILESDTVKGAKIVQVGNRVFNSDKSVLSFARPASSTSELIARIIKDNGMSMDADVSTDLIMGIEEGSSNFTSPDVTADTFEIVAFLLRNHGQRAPRTRVSPAAFPQGAIPTMPYSQQPRSQVNQVKQVDQVKQEESQAVQTQAYEQTEATDLGGTQESEADINPPDDWLQPKVYTSKNPPITNPDSFSENKG